jgi:hypothetical protein
MTALEVSLYVDAVCKLTTGGPPAQYEYLFNFNFLEGEERRR